jgi:hypothetical protein
MSADIAQVDSSFLARYGRVIVSRGIAAVPRALFTHQKVLGLTPQRVWFVCYILSFQWDTTLPYPSIYRMAERTGYSKQQLHNIKAELVQQGYLILRRRINEEGGNDTNTYDFSPLLEAIRAHLQPHGSINEHPETPTSAGTEDAISEGTPTTQEPAKVRRHRQSAPKHSRFGSTPPTTPTGRKGPAMELSTPAATELTISPAIELTRGPATGLTTSSATGLPTAVKQPSAARSQRALPAGLQRALPKVEPINEESLHRDDSNHTSPKVKKRGPDLRSQEDIPYPSANLPFSPYIAAVVSDYSSELRDPDHVTSNVTQALRLWHRSGLEEQEFVELLHTSRGLVRKYQGKQGLRTIDNKMAYFFTVLRRLVEDAPDERSDVRSDGRPNSNPPRRR